MKKIIITLLLLFSILVQNYAQQYFQKTFGTTADETNLRLKKTSNGNYICIGTTTVNGDEDIFVMELDQNFQEIWSNTYAGTSGYDDNSNILEIDSGDYVFLSRESQLVSSYTTSANIVRISNTGNLISAENIGIHHDRFRDIFLALDNKYIAWGSVEGIISTSANRPGFIVYDNNMTLLNTVWINSGNSENSISSNYEIYSNAMTQLIDSSYIISCQFNDQSTAVNDQMRIIKLDKYLNLDWVKGYWGSNYSNTRGILPLASGSFMCYGKTMAFNTAGGNDMWLTKIDSAGSHVWTKIYGTIGEEQFCNAIVNSSGNIVLSGYTDGIGAGGEDIVIMEVDTNGVILWSNTYGGMGDETPSAYNNIIETSTGYLITGHTNSFGAGGDDFYLLNTDFNGQVNDSCFSSASNQLAIDSLGIPTEYSRVYTLDTFNPPTNTSLSTFPINIVDTIVCATCPFADILFDSTICLGDTAMFVNLSTSYDSSYWSFGDFSNSSITSPSNIYDSIGIYGIYLFVYNSVGACYDSIYDTLQVFDINVNINPQDTAICDGETVIFDAGSGYDSYLWSNLDFTQTISVGSAGAYSVFVSDTLGCIASDTVILTINPLPIANSGNDTIVSPMTLFSLYATGGVSYQWIPSAGLSCDNCPNPTLSISSNATYCVEVTDSNGCKNTDCIYIEVDANDSVWAPNIFNPNSIVSDNNVFRILGYIDPAQFELIIFNRWGEKVHISTDPLKGWNGKNQEGVPFNNGVFYYIAKGNTWQGNEFDIKGTITLINQ